MLAFDSFRLLSELRLIHQLLFSVWLSLCVLFIRLVFQVCFFISLLTLVGSICISACVLSRVAFGCDRSKIFFFPATRLDVC